MADKNMANDTHQDHPHREGQGNNVNSSSPGNRNSEVNNSQPMSNMLQDSPEQLAGRNKNKDKENDEE